MLKLYAVPLAGGLLNVNVVLPERTKLNELPLWQLTAGDVPERAA